MELLSDYLVIKPICYLWKRAALMDSILWSKLYAMKIIFLSFFFLLLFSGCKDAPKYIMVLDQENLLTQDQIQKIDSLYKAHERITSNEIALIISSDLPDTPILKNATYLGRKYGVGKGDINNGVVILVCPGLRQVAIATGLGMEKVLKDEIAKKIIDSLMIPQFAHGEYFNAIWEGSLGIVHFLELPEHSKNITR